MGRVGEVEFLLVSILQWPCPSKLQSTWQNYTTKKSEVGGRGTNIMIENCKSAGNPLPIFEEIGNTFSVTLPLQESTKTHRTVLKLQEQSIVPRLTDRQHNILEVLKFGPLSRQQITKQIKDKLADRTIQQELSILKNMGLIQITGKTKDATWALIAH